MNWGNLMVKITATFKGTLTRNNKVVNNDVTYIIEADNFEKLMKEIKKLIRSKNV